MGGLAKATASVVAAGVTAAILFSPACASSPRRAAPPTTGSSASSDTESASQCSSAGIPAITLPSKAADEPTLSIPQPQGWELTTSQNSARVRVAIRNPSLKSHDFIPNAIVTLDDVSADSDTPESALYVEKTAISSKNPISNVTSGTVCGSPSETFDYTVNGRATTSLVVGAQEQHGKVWISTVVITTADPGNPEFVAEKRSILHGFRLTFRKQG